MRTIVFIDGQNLYHLAKKAWAPPPLPDGSRVPHMYSWPSYDVLKLARALVARRSDCTLAETRFYTGVPDPQFGSMQRRWFTFWTNKIKSLESAGVFVYQGAVNRWGQEKGVDVSLAIDLVKATYERRYDVAIIVSQDSDFGPAVHLSKEIAANQERLLSFESTFPMPEKGRRLMRGIPGTEWTPIDKSTYDSCYDSSDYRL